MAFGQLLGTDKGSRYQILEAEGLNLSFANLNSLF